MSMFGRIGAAFVAAASLASGPATADAIEAVAKDLRFPEGPLWFNGSLLFRGV